MVNPFIRAFKAASAFVMRFGNRWGWTWPTALGSTSLDYAREVGDGRGNAAVSACVLWVCRAFPEAPLRVRLRQGTELKPQPDHELTILLDQPNGFYSGHLLWSATLADWMLDGNAYWIKQRNGAGRVVALWWAPASTMCPKWDTDTEFVSYYQYNPGNAPQRIDSADVVHFRYGLDPDNVRLGCSPLKSLLREVFTDNEAANFTAALLRNLGVPGVVLSADDLTPDQAQQTKDEMNSKFRGDKRGEPLVLSGKWEARVMSFNPEQMQIREVRRIPEERISAIFGTPAVVVGLGAGLDRSTFANFAEAREAAYESNIIPTQRLMAAELRTQLLPDFGDPRRLVLDFDLSQVRVLQPDQDRLYSRVVGAVGGGLLSLNEGREMLGKEPLDGTAGDALLIPNSVTPTDPATLLAAPNPQPALPPGQDLAALPPPAKELIRALAKRAQRVTPLGADEPWADLPAEPTLDDATLERYLAAWEATVGEQYAGLLDAEVDGG